MKQMNDKGSLEIKNRLIIEGYILPLQLPRLIQSLNDEIGTQGFDVQLKALESTRHLKGPDGNTRELEKLHVRNGKYLIK